MMNLVRMTDEQSAICPRRWHIPGKKYLARLARFAVQVPCSCYCKKRTLILQACKNLALKMSLFLQDLGNLARYFPWDSYNKESTTIFYYVPFLLCQLYGVLVDSNLSTLLLDIAWSLGPYLLLSLSEIRNE